MKNKALSRTLIDTAKDFGLAKTTIDQPESLGTAEAEDLRPEEIEGMRLKINVSQRVIS